MIGHAYRHEADDDRALYDAHVAPVAEQEAPDAAAGHGQHGPQSLADIGFHYDGPAAEVSAGAGAGVGPPDLDQLALHGAAPEPSHIDPAATAVAQAEIETGQGAAIGLKEAPAHDAGGDLETGAATQPAAAAAPAAGHDEGHASHAQTWQDRARAYNHGHGLVEKFNAATANACGTGAEADPNAVAAWQTAHGVHPDGRIGQVTLAAATKPAAAKAKPHALAHAKPAEPAAAVATEPAAPAAQPTVAAKVEAKTEAKTGAKPDAAIDTGLQQKLRGQYAAVMKQFVRGQIDQAEAVKKLVAFDQKLNGGTPSMEGLMMLPFLLADLLKVTLARATSSTPTTPAATPAKPTGPTAPAVTKAPAQTPAVDTKPAAQPTQAAQPPQAATGPAISKVYHFNGLPTVRAFLPPGGVKGAVDVFAFFHGMYAHHDAKSKGVDDPERESHMAQAVAGSGRNLVALSPAAEMTQAQWPQWAALNKSHGYAQIVEQSLRQLSTDLGTPLTAGTISLAGHSAGGSALGEAAEQLGDAVHDVTLQDGGYGSEAFLSSHEKLVHWLLTGKVDKTVRVITHGDPDVVSEGKVLRNYLNVAAIQKAAAAANFAGVTVTLEPGDKAARSVTGMTLHHRLTIHGLPASRTVSVFNFKGEDHYEVRNKTMGHLIQEGPSTDFATSGAAAPKQDAAPTGAAHAHVDPKPQATPAHAQDAKATDPKPTTKAATPAQPTISAAAATADLGDLDGLVAAAHNPQVSAVAQHLHDLAAKFAQLTEVKALDNNEIQGDGRAELVKGIAGLHAEISALDRSGLELPKLDPIKTRMFRALQEISPYHSQGRNVDILERGEKERARAHAGGIKTRTCNITSLSMALEGLGKSAADYSGNRDVVLAVAKEFRPELKAAQLKGGGGKDDWGVLESLRLPDFMELAAIAELAKGKTDSQSIMSAASDAFDKILFMGFLGDLATRFGASADLRYFSYDGKQTHEVTSKGKTKEVAGTVEADKLGGASKDQRHDIDTLIDARNKAEALEGGDAKKHAKAQKEYEALKAHSANALSGKAAEKNVPLEAYKTAVTEQLGAELASGAAIETHVIGHFVRLRAIYPDHVIIDDPAQFGRAHKKVLWDEARAQGMFDKRLVIR
jgi:hypothetical protein